MDAEHWQVSEKRIGAIQIKESKTDNVRSMKLSDKTFDDLFQGSLMPVFGHGKDVRLSDKRFALSLRGRFGLAFKCEKEYERNGKNKPHTESNRAFCGNRV